MELEVTIFTVILMNLANSLGKGIEYTGMIPKQ
jgi:hypothetical protein